MASSTDHQKIWWGTLLILFHGTLGAPQVPCYFIFGDSLSDTGNTNGLNTQAKANFWPYGIDFPGGPTGRFTNGQTIVDVIAQLLGLTSLIPPFARVAQGGGEVFQGVNYASGAAGIRNETGQHLGDNIPMNKQLQNFRTTVSQMKKILGSEAATETLLSKCLYTVGIGSNDYINNYFLPDKYSSSHQYTPKQYAQVLIQQYYQQLKTLYEVGARKVAILGLGQLGCSPGELAAYGPTPGSNCSENVNVAVRIFNSQLVSLVDKFHKNFKDAKFTYINIYQHGAASLKKYGFKVGDSACCGGWNPCIRTTNVCLNRHEYVYWDLFRPTEAANFIFGGRAFKARTPSDVHPVDISTLAKL